MLNDIEILKKMINDTAIVPLRQDHYSEEEFEVDLQEPQCSDSSVTIKKLPNQVIIINLDECWCIEKMFTHENGQCKRSDFVIVANGDEKVIICIEMKRKKDQKKNIVQQLAGARCFISFCRNIGQDKAFWDKEDFLDDYKYRFVCIVANISIDKRPTRIKPSAGVHDSPEKMLKIKNPTYLPFKRLIKS